MTSAELVMELQSVAKEKKQTKKIKCKNHEPIERPVTTRRHRDLVYISLSFLIKLHSKTEWGEMQGFLFQEWESEEGAEWAQM